MHVCERVCDWSYFCDKALSDPISKTQFVWYFFSNSTIAPLILFNDHIG